MVLSLIFFFYGGEGGASEAQKSNAELANVLHHLDGNVRRCVACLPAEFPAEGRAGVTDALRHLRRLQSAALRPLLASLADAVEAILLTMHDEDFHA